MTQVRSIHIHPKNLLRSLLGSVVPVRTPAFTDGRGRTIPSSIAAMKTVTIGGLPQRLWFRGSSQDNAEHTLGAYLAALDEGAEGLECDVRLTADGAYSDLRVARDGSALYALRSAYDEPPTPTPQQPRTEAQRYRDQQQRMLDRDEDQGAVRRV